jgi:GH15 family glucan-1,4-alpha-glucosidase
MADALVAEVNNDCLHPSWRWQRAPSDPRVDASLLLPVIRGAVPSGDPRAVATVDGVLDELSEDHFLYRFRQGPGRLSDTEGAFLLCGFHAAIALAQRGDHVEAARWFERTRSACGPSGLFTEEFDVVQRQLRGNLPQAFVHGALIEASAVMAELNGGA